MENNLLHGENATHWAITKIPMAIVNVCQEAYQNKPLAILADDRKEMEIAFNYFFSSGKKLFSISWCPMYLHNCTNLLESVNDWTLSIQNKRGVTVAYIDFSRAFDTVSHEKLINGRLKSYLISGDLLSWLRNFLRGRTHQTKIGFNLSSVAKLLSGVIRGSGIGPSTF